MTLDTILIANRGEIACRIIRTLRAMGLRSVAVHSQADAGAPHVVMADAAVEIGAGPVADSYLDGAKIIHAAQEAGAQAIHPGYGFLSENADFARAVGQAGLVFIGPTPEAIEAMGNKAGAKRLMGGAGVPCLPGYEGADQSDAALIAAAGQIGFPLMVKAAAGGGGRGMRLVHDAAHLPEALTRARSEAENAFGSDELILERALLRPRHVEIQVFADSHGTCLHLGERDCSVQRRHQKVVEEAPSPAVTPELRAAMGAAAVQAARAVDYRGAGTVEFLLDEDGAFYFLEMNTRLQVEHPVTELVTGLDLVALQIAVARGDALPITQDEVRLSGHAIEVRLYAEDPAKDYLPATGPVTLWHPAEGVGIRVDAGIETGMEVSPFYDPMLAKIVAHGATRADALARLIRAVEETVLLGTVTNTEFLADVLRQPAFAGGEATTAFLVESYPQGFAAAAPSPDEIALAAVLFMERDRAAALARAGHVPADQLGWSSTPLLPRDLALHFGGETLTCRIAAAPDGWRVWAGGSEVYVLIEKMSETSLRARIGGRRHNVTHAGAGEVLHLARGARRLTFHRPGAGRDDAAGAASGHVAAPMPGQVLSVAVAPGDRVARGDTLAVLEAMKMQHQIAAATAGTVIAVHVAPGAQIAGGDAMIEIEPEE
ncbi:acetyl/propionyl/methylcrotonyl-CoA carboxylase subunit alpha [Antarcticimicrobium luteum]|uniref:Acetyl-CoA carboxylase biotin carboxylase subunit n=1 Tax=Antarcticimicrobium luteum TaxID=2547397 RepID=A0A4R5UQF4_9RHOB|nr:acetyl-CoA carboxylase biotin carboxylase subunit [Antarcticimicrobium luteum]TDK41155.1 acetyl-CoA carboxylase biotin carboxylase subunit [Antarcticimicrobium luteum]